MPELLAGFTMEMALVLGITAVAVLLFLTQWLRVDVTALLVMVSLPMLGLIDPRETFRGLASTAVVSIIAVVIMGRGLDHAGIINRGVRPLMRLAGGSRSRIIVLLSGAIAIISSFMQNIGAAALFLPAIRRLARRSGTPASQLLMPVGFAAILGGTVTLVGSSPLIMLNDLIRPSGLKPFGLFDVTPIGLALVATGILYFLVVGRRLLPGGGDAPETCAADADPCGLYPGVGQLYEVEVTDAVPEGLRVMDLCDGYNAHVVGLALAGGAEGNQRLLPPDREMVLRPGMTAALYGPEVDVARAEAEAGLRRRSGLVVFAEDLSRDMAGVVEAVVPPQSPFVGKTLAEVRFRHHHLMAPLALSRGEGPVYSGLGGQVLRPGDAILMHGRWESFHRMRPRRDLLFAQSLDHEILHPEKAPLALVCFALSTVLVAVTDLPLSVCLMTGALGMVLTGVLDMDEAYRGVDWRTVFLLAGLIPLGAAMQRSGAAAWIADGVLLLAGHPSPPVFYLIVGALSTAVTLVVSNVGATVLLVPLATDMAVNIGADPRLAALAVALAASNSFLLPTHQVNALYMGPGGYGSMDFVRVGAPLSALFLAVLTLMLWLIY